MEAGHPEDQNVTHVPVCVICLQELIAEHGTLFATVDCPSKHLFHLRCIEVWLEQTSNCPHDRGAVSRLLVKRSDPESDVIEREEIVQQRQPRIDHPWEQETVCRVCQLGDREHVLLLCDLCDDPYHTTCVGLEDVPPGDWFCQTCTEIQASRPPAPSPRVTAPTRIARRSIVRQRIHGADTNTIRAARAFAQALRMRTELASDDSEWQASSDEQRPRSQRVNRRKPDMELINSEFVDNRYSDQSKRKRRHLHSAKTRTPAARKDKPLDRLDELTNWAQAVAQNNQTRIAPANIRVVIPQVDQTMLLEKERLLSQALSALEPPSSSTTMLAALNQLVEQPKSQPVNRGTSCQTPTQSNLKKPDIAEWKQSKTKLFEQFIKPRLDELYKAERIDRDRFKYLGKAVTDTTWLMVNSSAIDEKELKATIQDTMTMLLK